jgi:hypothetical protein
MKKLFLIAILAATVSVASAQVQVAIGLKAGPNFSSINTTATAGENYKNRTGFHGGAFINVKMTKIAIQPEILFSQQGSTVKIDSKNYDQNFSYINVPIIVKLYLAAGLNLQVGPQFGFVSLAEAPTKDQLTGTWSVQDVKDQAKKYDLSAAFGAGWDLPFGLTVDARYNLGLSKIYGKSSPNPDQKNQVIQVSLGYKIFKFGK